MVPVRPGYVRLLTDLFSLDILTIAEPYLLSEGFAAKWGTIERSGRIDAPTWNGGALLRQAIPVTMDVLVWPRLDIDDEWTALRHLARPANAKRPPVLRLAGPVDHKELDWTIVSLDIDPATTKRRGHRMVRQSCVITVQQWPGAVTEDTLSTRAPARDRERKVKTTAGMNTVKKIAKHYRVKWQAIRDLNKGLGDPDRHLPVGTSVWIPPASASRDPKGSGTGGAKAPS